jgi:hypothetical protein
MKTLMNFKSEKQEGLALLITIFCLIFIRRIFMPNIIMSGYELSIYFSILAVIVLFFSFCTSINDIITYKALYFEGGKLRKNRLLPLIVWVAIVILFALLPLIFN